jgi:hypothetical protein
MDEQQQVEIDGFEIDGSRLCFEHGMILIDTDISQWSRWHAVFLHPRSGDAPSTPVVAPVIAHTVAGKRLKGRIWRGDPARGAGSLVLHGLGSLERE